MSAKHSPFGIASFIMSILVGPLIFVLTVSSGIMELSTPGGIDETSIEAMLLGLFIMAALFAELISFGLGIAGLMQKDRKKVFSILGVIFSLIPFITTVALIAIGLFLEK